MKYRLTYGPVHFGAMYKFADGQGGCFSASAAWTGASCTPEAPHNSAYGFDLGAVYRGFSAEVVVQRVNQAISVVNPLLGPASLSAPYQATVDSINTNPINGTNLIGTANTEYGIVTDNTAAMVAAKYAWSQFKLFGGYEYIRYTNPASPLGISAHGSGVTISRAASKTKISTLPGLYKYSGPGLSTRSAARPTSRCPTTTRAKTTSEFRRPARPPPAFAVPARVRSTGRSFALRGLSLHASGFDVYSGIAYSDVSGGLAIAIPHGPGVPYFSDDNVAPTVGGRFAF